MPKAERTNDQLLTDLQDIQTSYVEYREANDAAAMSVADRLHARARNAILTRMKPKPQGIGTAPIDGTVFLGTCAEAQHPRWSLCWAQGDAWMTVGKPEKFVQSGPCRWWPTHWLPMPPSMDSLP